MTLQIGKARKVTQNFAEWLVVAAVLNTFAAPVVWPLAIWKVIEWIV